VKSGRNADDPDVDDDDDDDDDVKNCDITMATETAAEPKINTSSSSRRLLIASAGLQSASHPIITDTRAQLSLGIADCTRGTHYV